MLTTELNASASNGPFPSKVEKIVADSDLRLNAWLRTDPPATWTETSIITRGERLFASALEIWPIPFDEPQEVEADPADAENAPGSGWQFTDQVSLNGKRKELLAAFAAQRKISLVADTIGKHRSIDGSVRVTLTISKRYDDRAGYPYWYAFHPDWEEYLADATEGYFMLGMMDRSEGYALPLSLLQPLLPLLNTTVRADTGKLHWHVHVVEEHDGVALLLPKAGKTLPIDTYAVGSSEFIAA